MPKASKFLSSEEKEKKLEVARQMFSQKKDFVGEKIAFGSVGQIVFWNEEKNFGFIRTHDMKDSDDSFYCHGSAFLNQCGNKDIVKFDVWENYQTKKQKAVNVRFLQQGTSVIATDEIGTMSKWFGLCQKGIIKSSDDQEYRCSAEDFEQGDFPRGSRVCFNIMKDNWTSHCRAVNIRNAKIARHVHRAGVEGTIVKLTRSCGFVSTKLCDEDIYFNGRELTRLHMKDIRYRDRITFNMIMEENGSLTAEDIDLHVDTAKTRQLVKEAQLLVADSSANKVPDDTVKKPAVDDDCASTAASEVPHAAPEPINQELRKLSKKLREICDLEGRRDLDQLQQAKVAKKQEYQQRLDELTA